MMLIPHDIPLENVNGMAEGDVPPEQMVVFNSNLPRAVSADIEADTPSPNVY